MDNDKRITNLEERIAELERINKALVKVASHDVRSPLNKLYALVGLFKLSDGDISEEQQGYLNKMEVVISDGLNKMKNLMDLHAIETAGVITMPETIDIVLLTKRMIREFIPIAQRKHIHIDFNSSSKSIALYIDRLSYIRILDQLISNAYKFTPESKTIQLNIEDDADQCVIAVVDGGYGIKKSEQALLYQKFKVLSSTATGGESCVGLGLYLAQWNARNMGGEIKYDNTSGSTFSLTLPKVRMA
jgi:signal transduction histidine kinase